MSHFLMVSSSVIAPLPFNKCQMGIKQPKDKSNKSECLENSWKDIVYKLINVKENKG